MNVESQLKQLRLHGMSPQLAGITGNKKAS